MSAVATKSRLFETAFERSLCFHRVYCNPGKRMKIEYQPVYDKKGVWHLEETGETSLYDSIQSFADSVDINLIMSRYKNGEIDVLNRVQGFYGDVSNVPTNYADILNETLKAERLFMSLAPEVRERYNNSISQFMSEIGTKEGQEKLYGSKSGSDINGSSVSSGAVSGDSGSVSSDKDNSKKVGADNA